MSGQPGLVFQLYFSRQRVAPWALDTFLSKSQDGCCMARATGMSLLDADSLGATHGLWLCDFSWDEVLEAVVLLSREQQGCGKQWFSPSQK